MMNNTLALIDNSADRSLVYKVKEIDYDDHDVVFEIACISDEYNLHFTHALFEDDLETLNRFLKLECDTYHFIEPDIYFQITTVLEDKIALSCYIDLNLIKNRASNDKYNEIPMFVDKSSLVQLIKYLMHHATNF